MIKAPGKITDSLIYALIYYYQLYGKSYGKSFGIPISNAMEADIETLI